MKIWLSSLFFLLIPVSVLAQPAAYHCQFPSQQGPRALNLYSSDRFHADVSEYSAVQTAWNDYIRATYSVKPGEAGTCESSILIDRNPNYATDWEKKKQQQTPGVTAIHVTWAYASKPGQASAPTVPPPNDPCNILTEHRMPSTPCTHALATSYVVCSATDASPMAYVGATFQVTAVDTAKWTSTFAQFLAENYGYKGAGVGCNVLHEDGSRTFLKGRVLGLRANGKNVVETGWTYNSSPAVAVDPIPSASTPTPVVSSPASSAAPAPPAGAPVIRAAARLPTRYGICWAAALTAPNTAYFSASFESAAPNVQAWNKAYREVLRDRYQLKAINVHCSIHPSRDDAESVRSHVDPNSKIIETGWKSE